jgi:hypothetical protein
MVRTIILNKENTQLSEEAAARIANKFEIPEKRHELSDLIANCNRRYQAHLREKDHHQRKQVLEQVSESLIDMAEAAAKLPQRFADPDTDRILWVAGSLLSRQGLQTLIGASLKLPRESSDALGEVARQVGPDLLVSLSNALRQPVDEILDIYRLHKGGRPRQHFYRDFVIQELGRNYQRFFGKLPTHSRTGHFARFCGAVLEELQLELKGYDRTFPALLRAIGAFEGLPRAPLQRT